MKLKLIGVFFYSIYLLALVKPIFPLIDYVINYNYIVTQLCENRDKPYLACNGKCYLEKELQKAEKSTQNTNSTIPKVNVDTFPITILEEISFNLNIIFETKTAILPVVVSNHYNSFTSNVFKPPKFVA